MDLERFGRIVYERRMELGLTQDEVANQGGPTDTTMGKIENGDWTPGNRHTTFRKLDTGLRWRPGSARTTLDGGEPEPIPDDAPEFVRDVMAKMPVLPRNAPNAPVLGELMKALGQNPGAPNASIPMTAEERQVLTSVRNKIAHDGGDLSDVERRLLARFIEDDELRTLHVRIDWLPRAEQLEVSTLVNKLQMDLEYRWVADGYTNESEQLPDYAQPNPLPVEGIAPNPEDFPSQVPNFVVKAHRGDVAQSAFELAARTEDEPKEDEVDE